MPLWCIRIDEMYRDIFSIVESSGMDNRFFVDYCFDGIPRDGISGGHEEFGCLNVLKVLKWALMRRKRTRVLVAVALARRNPQHCLFVFLWMS